MKKSVSRLLSLALILASLGFGACDREESRSDGQAADLKRALPEFEAPQDARSKEIEALTGGHTRIVWAQQQDPDKTDAHGNGSNHQLMGLGTRDGVGERVILGKVGNYSRPLLTPDGERVVYTDKGMKKVKGKKAYAPTCYVVNWDGSGKKELADVYADDIWVDPGTGITWVYGIDEIVSNKQVSIVGRRVVRFQLDDPAKSEVVFEKGEVSVNNLQASRDGKRIATQFPWPYGGMLDVEAKEWTATDRGCWTSMCPDNSYLSWVFDGAHKNLIMIHPDQNEKWLIPVSDLPGFKNKEMYHPRWSNHPRFFALTGPYPPGTRNTSGDKVEAYIGKFDPGATKVVAWVTFTKNKLAELFPDVWIEGGEKESLDRKQIGKAPEGEPEVVKARVKEVEAGTWPANEDKLVFAWDNIANEKRVGDRPCRVELHGRARFGRFYDAVLGGGTAVPDGASVAALGDLGAEATVEFLLTAATDADGVVFTDGTRVVFVAGKRIYGKTGDAVWDAGVIQPGVPTHLSVQGHGETGILFRDGVRVTEAATVTPPESGAGLVFGDGIWEGTVQGIGIYNRALPAEEIERNAATWTARVSERKPTVRVVLKGKLVEVTPLKTKTEIGAYNRALSVYTYEVEEVTEGAYASEKALVSHWYYMDDTFLTSMPREIGRSYELTIEPASDHPQIESELTDYEGADFETPVYFDVTTPEP